MKRLQYILGLLLLCGVSRAGIISHTDYTAGSVITAAGQNANENTIVNEFNGNINSANIASLGIVNSNIANNTIDVSKITSGSNNSGQVITSTTSGTVAKWSNYGQVIQSTMCLVSGSSSTISTTFVPTTVTCTITPKVSTSFIKIVGAGEANPATDSTTCYYSIFRGTTNLSGSNGLMGMKTVSSATTVRLPYYVQYLDSPASTSATVYTIYFRNDSTSQCTINDVSQGTLLLEEIGN